MRRVVWVWCVISLVGVVGCTWVKPSTSGAKVREATAAEVAGCEAIGTASGTTRTSFAGLPRNQEVIHDEQVTLARNQAGVIGGDTMVATGPASGGTLTFSVYRCH